jgi:NADH-quinone oxidoreductase subunit G
LTKTESIDVMDAVGSNIRVDARGRAIMRILPRLNEAVNEEWISDKTRFAYDGLAVQRLDQPYVRKGGKLKPASWDEAFAAIAKVFKKAGPGKTGAIAGDLCSVEDMFALKKLMMSIGSPNLDCREAGSVLDPSNGRASYLFNATIDGIEDSDALLIIGSNPRIEAPVLNARIRKRYRMPEDYPIGVIGEAADLRYEYTHLGAGPDALGELLSGKNRFAARLKKAKRPIILIGQGALNRSDSAVIYGQAAQLAIDCGAVKGDWNGFCILHTAAARAGGLDIGFVPGKNGSATADIQKKMDLVFLLGADEIDTAAIKGFTVYIGTHGDAGAHRADVILPGSTYTEKPGIYVNTEGRVQVANRAIFAPGQAKEDWAIFRALSAVFGEPLSFDSLRQLRDQLQREYPHFQFADEVVSVDGNAIAGLAKSAGKVNKRQFISPVQDFYLTNPIARASKVMAECSLRNNGSIPQAAE